MESKCRMRSQHEETVNHILSGCEVLAITEYITKHNKAAAYLHWRIYHDYAKTVAERRIIIMETLLNYFSYVQTIATLA